MSAPFARVSGEAFDADPLEHTCTWCGDRSCDCEEVEEPMPVKSREEQALDYKRACIQIARAMGRQPDPEMLADVRLYDLGNDTWRAVA